MGTSIAIFGGLVFISGIVLIPILDALTIDFLALYLFFVGMDIRKGIRRSIKWPAIWCGCYVAVCMFMICCTILAPEKVEVGKYHLTEGWPAVITVAILFFFLIWSASNLLGLLKNRQKVTSETINSEE